MKKTNWVVLKFGGTSVSSLDCWKNIEKIIKERLKDNLTPLIVCSALAGISDLLENLVLESVNGNHKNILTSIENKHKDFAYKLDVDFNSIKDNIEELDRLPLETIKTKYQLWIEPGRFIVANAGVLIAKVTQLKQKGKYYYVGINTGMNTLIRPALYGSYHEIVNLTCLDQPASIEADIVGHICESGDIFGYSRLLPETKDGDIVLIDATGAYGKTMSSNYNMRTPAKEYFLFKP